MKIRSLNDAMEILQKDTAIAKLKTSIGEDISIDTILDHSGDYVIDTELANYLSITIDEIGFSKAAVMKNAGIDEVTGFQIFSGITAPDFNTLMRICIGATMNLEETQKAIQLAGFIPLDPDNRRDKILIHGLTYMKNINAINESLYSEDLPIL